MKIHAASKLPVIAVESIDLSAYLVGEKKIYLITEADRSQTTILFSSEY